MNRRTFLKAVPAFVLLAAKTFSWAADAVTTSSGPARAAEPTSEPAQSASRPSIGSLKPIQLLPPEKDGGKSVMAALWARKTNRNISEKPLPPQVLSNLLWAAFGVNREPRAAGGKPGRTAATASNSQEIDLYVALADGVYLYEAVGHRLTPVVEGDFRAKVGRGRRSGGQAPVRIIFVADLAKFNQGRPQEPGLKDPEIQKSYYNIATGLIAGNVYLFAASQDLAAWFHNCDKSGLTKDLDLRPEQRVLYAQTVGYPA